MDVSWMSGNKMRIFGFVLYANLVACGCFFAILVSGSLTWRMAIIGMSSYAV
jgi:hypothetical protein